MKTTDNKLINNPSLAKLNGKAESFAAKQFDEDADLYLASTDSEELRRNWNALRVEKPVPVPQTDSAWQKLNIRLRNEGLLAPQLEPVKRFSVKPALQIAASVLLLAGIAIVVWLATARNDIKYLSIETGNEQETRIKTLADGSVIYLGGHSKIEYPEVFASNGRSVKLAGEAFFDIAHDAVRPFVIETEGVKIKVLGTAFTVKDISGNHPEVIVNRGKVEVSRMNDPDNKTILVAGEKTLLLNEKFIVTKVVDKQDDNWYKKRMHFKDETLTNIVNVLNANFNTNFEVSDYSVAGKRLTLTFEGQTADQMKEIICVYCNLSSKESNGKVLLTGKNNSK